MGKAGVVAGLRLSGWRLRGVALGSECRAGGTPFVTANEYKEKVHACKRPVQSFIPTLSSCTSKRIELLYKDGAVCYFVVIQSVIVTNSMLLI